MKQITRIARIPGIALALIGSAAIGAAPLVARAGEADVLAVKLKCRELVCDFAVTLKHADDGWQHYADAWEILSEDGKLLAKRVLRHPHLEEQPFTRSLPGVKLPEGTTRVVVRGHDKVHGHGGIERSVDIPGTSSPQVPRKEE